MQWTGFHFGLAASLQSWAHMLLHTGMSVFDFLINECKHTQVILRYTTDELFVYAMNKSTTYLYIIRICVAAVV